MNKLKTQIQAGIVMKNTNIFVSRNIPGNCSDMLSEHYTLRQWKSELPPSVRDIEANVKGTSAIISLLSDRIDGSIMDIAGSGLKVIANYAVGYDNIEVEEAIKRGIWVTNTPGVLTESTADLTFALILSSARRISEAERYVKEDRWKTWGPELMLGLELNNSTLGIVGMGRIGTAVARRAAGFGMKVIYLDYKGRKDLGSETGAVAVNSLDELLRESDIISLHTPLSGENTGLIGEKQLAMMKKETILINTARGKLVDTEALYEALKKGTISFAALDVTDPEPLRSEHKLLELKNCLVVPHIGSATIHTRHKMGEMVAENVIAVMNGRVPPWPVKECVQRLQTA